VSPDTRKLVIGDCSPICAIRWTSCGCRVASWSAALSSTVADVATLSRPLRHDVPAMRRLGTIIKRTLLAFYDDQMTQHAAALTYYGLMSLFPAVLLGLSLLGLLGEYPRTYNAIIGYLRDVAPASVVVPLDSSLRGALRSQGTAATTLSISVVVALYGTTGVLEAARRALNVVYEVDGGRRFLRRKAIDVLSTFALMALALASLIMIFVGGKLADDLLRFIGLGRDAAPIWNLVRWPGALAVAMFVFAFIYYVTPDVRQRSFRSVAPGAAVGVLLWLGASVGFATYISQIAHIGAIYGAFTGAIVLVGWLWLSNVALLLGAELNAEIEREKELDEGVPPASTLNRPERGP
jgi:membrane protein